MEHHGKRIEEIREQRGMSKAELGRRIGTSNQNVHDIITREEIKQTLLEKLGKALGHDFIDEFYKPDYEVVIEPGGEEVAEHIREKYRMQGRIDQMEILLKKNFSKELSDELLKQMERQLSAIGNQLDSLIEKQEKIDKWFEKTSSAQKKA